jgi:hypothetical protein
MRQGNIDAMLCAFIVMCSVALIGCSEDPIEPAPPLSTNAQDYFYQGGIGSVWEYTLSQKVVDTNGITLPAKPPETVRFTLIDMNRSRKGVDSLMFIVRENIGSDGVLNDSDTLYFRKENDGVTQYRLPLSSVDSKRVILRGPLTRGSWFFEDGEDDGDGGKFTVAEVDIPKTTPVGTFRTAMLRKKFSTVVGNGAIREHAEDIYLTPSNFAVASTIEERTAFSGGTPMVELTTVTLVRIDRKP